MRTERVPSVQKLEEENEGRHEFKERQEALAASAKRRRRSISPEAVRELIKALPKIREAQKMGKRPRVPRRALSTAMALSVNLNVLKRK